MALTAEQRARLQRTKLAALVRAHLDLEGEPFDIGAATALQLEHTVAVLVDTEDPGALSGALLAASRRDARRLVLYVDDGAGALARWASYFELPEGIEVRRVVGAGSEPAEPSPLPPVAARPEQADEVTSALRAAGVEVVVEHGVVRGEVLGLEVARAVRWPAEHGGDDQLHLEAGVGRFDRDAVAAARPDDPPAESLRRAVDMVRTHRYPGAPVHPLQLLARSRWLRAQLLEQPALVGAAELHATGTTVEPGGIKDVAPAAAVGHDPGGRPLVVVASAGVDLSLVPLAADTRAQHGPEAALVLAVPPADLHRATETLVSMLREPARLVPVEPGWG